MRIRIVLPLAALAAACVPREAPPPAVQPRPTATPAPMPAQPLASDWRDWPVTPGTWTYRRDARGSLALFGRPQADALLTLRCDAAARQLYLSRAGESTGPLTVRTTSLTRTLPVRPTNGTPPYVAVALAPTDALLDAMAFSRGHFTVEQAGAAPLVIPAWAEIGRTIEDCRG